MASREQREELRRAGMQQRKEKDFKAACEKLGVWPILAACALFLALVLMAAAWAEIYNTDIHGPEAKMTGFSLALACVTRDFTSVSKIYGDMAVPFYYYAGTYTEKLAAVSLVCFILLAAGLAVNVVARVKNAAKLNFACAALSLLAAVMIFVSMAVTHSMNGSDILPYFCSGNPACSIRSYAIFPAIFALIAMGFSGAACVKYFQAKKLLT